MLKYVDTMVTFSEVPDEITLCINISNCPCKCEGCHSSYLAEDIGKPLNWGNLNTLIHINTGITCVSFMGGDSNPREVSDLAYHVQKMGLLTCWYSGRQELSRDIDLKNFNFIKLGPYIEEKGPLTSPTTNQKFYEVVMTREIDEHDDPVYALDDITYKFWKNDNE